MVCLSSKRSRSRRSGRSHSAVVVAFVLGIGAAMLGYSVFPDNVMLILGPVVLGSLVMASCGSRKPARSLGSRQLVVQKELKGACLRRRTLEPRSIIAN